MSTKNSPAAGVAGRAVVAVQAEEAARSGDGQREAIAVTPFQVGSPKVDECVESVVTNLCLSTKELRAFKDYVLKPFGK
jgi:hypothetical protein